MTTPRRTIAISAPLVAPFMTELSAGDVRAVWDSFVKPEQDSGIPQSVEMRCLMAILRAVFAGMTEEDGAA